MRLPRRYIIVPGAVLLTSEESQRAAPNETGGILIGRNAGEYIEIKYASPPGPKARHSRSGFCRDGDFTQAFLDDIFNASGGASTYVGEWHSHPDGLPTPSPRDVRSIRWIADSEDYATPEPILGLSVRAQDGWRLFLYIWERGRFWPMDLVR